MREQYYLQNGHSPSTTKIAEAVGISRGTAYKYLVEMADTNAARFHIEGLTEQELKTVPAFFAPYDTDVYCATCNKTVFVKKGDQIPICCGKLMEIID